MRLSVSRSLGLAVIAVMASANSARSAYLATDLGAGNSYNTTSGYNLTGPSSGGPGIGLAVEFSIGGASPVAFGSAQLALEFIGGTNALTVMLMSDAGGSPGSTLETMSLANIQAGPSLVTATSTKNTMLDPGTDYWLAASATGTTFMSWMQNSQNQANHLAYEVDFGSGPLGWNVLPGSPDLAYSISGASSVSAASAVPGPGSFVLLGSGVIGLVGLSRVSPVGRRR